MWNRTSRRSISQAAPSRPQRSALLVISWEERSPGLCWQKHRRSRIILDLSASFFIFLDKYNTCITESRHCQIVASVRQRWQHGSLRFWRRSVVRHGQTNQRHLAVTASQMTAYSDCICHATTSGVASHTCSCILAKNTSEGQE